MINAIFGVQHVIIVFPRIRTSIDTLNAFSMDYIISTGEEILMYVNQFVEEMYYHIFNYL